MNATASGQAWRRHFEISCTIMGGKYRQDLYKELRKCQSGEAHGSKSGISRRRYGLYNSILDLPYHEHGLQPRQFSQQEHTEGSRASDYQLVVQSKRKTAQKSQDLLWRTKSGSRRANAYRQSHGRVNLLDPEQSRTIVLGAVRRAKRA